MGDTTTPNLGLIKPEVGASRSTWGTKWNANADDLDSHFATLQSQITTLQSQVATLQNQVSAGGSGGVPIGGIFPWPVFVHAPSNYLDCRGQAVAIATYPTLFGVLGTKFGGDGVTNFVLPDMRGCVPAGYEGGTGRLGNVPGLAEPGTIVGSAYTTLTLAQIPGHQHAGFTDAEGAHEHDYTTYDLPGGSGFAVGAGAQFIARSSRTSTAGDHYHTIQTDFQGGGAGHLNVQVCFLVMWLIRAL